MRSGYGRYLRSGVGLALLFPGVWLVLHQLVWVSSSDAIIQAPTYAVKTPIQGELRFGTFSAGDHLRAGQVVAEVDNVRVDVSRLSELNARLASAEAEIAASERSLEQYRVLLASLHHRSGQYQRQRIAQLSALIEASRSQLSSARGVAAVADENLERARAMLSGGLISSEALTQKTGEVAIARGAVESTAKQLESLEVARSSMAQGVTLDAYSDRPYSLQKVDEVEIALVRHRAVLTQRTQERATLLEEAKQEAERVAHLRRAAVQVPRGGRVWRVAATSGEHVNAGQTLLEVIDCSKLVVRADLSQRKYGRVKVGTRATFTPDGMSTEYEGVVVQMLGLTPPELAFSTTPTKVFGVLIKLPLMAAQLAENCHVSLTGEARFHT